MKAQKLTQNIRWSTGCLVVVPQKRRGGMWRRTAVHLALVAMLTAAGSALAQTPMGTGFTYQGRLGFDGAPINDTADFEFTLWTADIGGSQVGSVVAINNVSVVDGLFTAELDFGATAFTSDARWLEIKVASPTGTTFETLTPRQPLKAAPYALQTRGLLIGDNKNVAIAPFEGNVASGQGAIVGGGISNTTAQDWSTIGGGKTNSISFWGFNGTIAGGASNNIPGDGSGNNTIGGGNINTAQGGASTVAGGSENIASGLRSTVGGGHNNTASGDNSVVAGGGGFLGGSLGNTASGMNSTVPGGALNVAAGNFTFAAGRRAKAQHNGAFVWADTTELDFTSTDPNQFLVRAAGGVGINKSDPATALDVLGTVTATTFVGDGSALTNVPGTWSESGADIAYTGGRVGVGVGANPPLAQLHVGGTAGTDGIMFPDGTLQLTAFATASLPDGHSLNSADGNTVDALFVDNSGNVGIGTNTPTNALDVRGNVNVDGAVALDQTQEFGFDAFLQSSDISQTFTAAVSGKLTRIELVIGPGNTNPSGTLRFFAGDEISGQLVAQQAYSNFPVGAADWRAIDFDSPPVVQAGQLYTLRLVDIHEVAVSMSNPYPGGQAFENPDWDLSFRTYVKQPAAVTVSGNVGIGTATPNAKLEVTGIPGTDGIMFPDGSLQTTAFTGVVVPDGHSLDSPDGSAVDALVVDNTGNVGIGTTSPGGLLQLGEASDDAAFKHGAAGPHHLVSNRDMVFNAFDGDDTIDGHALFLFRRNTNQFDESLYADLMTIDDRGFLGVGRDSASHPVHVGSDTTNGNGAHVTTGGTWTNGSSREWKSNFRKLDPQEVLDRLATLSIQRWEYTGSDEGDHIGPIAEDFYAAFGLGSNEQYIATVDADGVALAAIQGLHDLVNQKDAEIEALRDRMVSLEALVRNLSGQ